MSLLHSNCRVSWRNYCSPCVRVLLLLLIWTFGVSVTNCRPSSGSELHRDKNTGKDEIWVKDLHIEANIRFRYVETLARFQVVNRSNKSEDVTFYITIGSNSGTRGKNETSGGFISRAELKTSRDRNWRKSAINLHSMARQKFSTGTGITPVNSIAKKPRANLIISGYHRDLSRFELIVTAQPRDTTSVRIVYEEFTHIRVYANYLRYAHKISLKPKQMSKVLDFSVVLNIEEHDKPKNTMIYAQEGIQVNFSKTEENNQSAVSLRWTPNKRELTNLISKSLIGELTVMFDLPLDSEDKEVLARDGYFIHYSGKETWDSDVPPATSPIHTVFVLDISGSMRSQGRLKQLKEGMNTILNELRHDDFLDIITFSNIIQEWNPMHPNTSPFPAARDYKNSARDFINNLSATGSTNIYGALKRAIDKVKLIQNTTEDSQFKSIIFFLTDGEPTSGLTNRTEILRRIQNMNEDSNIPIFSLAFGKDADRPLCTELSAQHGGFTRQIFDMRNASLLMQDFFYDIAALIANNITTKNYKKDANFTSGSVFSNSLENTDFDPSKSMAAVVLDVGPCQHYRSQTKNPVTTLEEMNRLRDLCRNDPKEKIHQGSSFQEKLWAFVETRKSLQLGSNVKLKCPDKLEKYYGGPETFPISLTRMALHYEFITPCTSMVLDVDAV